MITNSLSQDTPFFCSWSGGKDSCLSLYRSIKQGFPCASLFTMVDETGERSRSHGLVPDILRAQAQAMGIPLQTTNATWGNYETSFKEQLARFKCDNIHHGVFGDIDLEPHREWVERVCRECAITAHLPLWKGVRKTLVEEFVDAGFKALIVVINTKMMPEHFLGRIIDKQLIGELEAVGVDACGENGEFHTFVFDGPLFKKQLQFSKGDCIKKNEYVFQPIACVS